MWINVLLVIATPLVYLASDFLAKETFVKTGWSWAMLHEPYFLLGICCKLLAFVAQLYLMAHIPLGKIMGMLAILSILSANALGYFYFNEMLSLYGYIAILLLIVAIVLLAFS